MMTDDQSESSMPAEDDAVLWSLLDRAKRPGPVSPYFARRVLREVAALEEVRPAAGRSAPGWLARLWQAWHGQARGVFAGALAAVVLLVVGSAPLRWRATAVPSVASVTNPAATDPLEVATVPDVDPATPAVVAAEPPVAAQDVEVIADLDNLLSREESRLWTDEDNTTARF